ncbi:alpha/beta fold hydrolase [Blastococcus sp. URHD0036]|uniref:alpha/beta fold hydrolase n=1 Tax=Blastococcus sp. URHD0036 TaxID=1380356 RepID=UPI0009DE9F0C|nr:alpha/beta hydrolase [Blastococcus sp. URHD0036]
MPLPPGVDAPVPGPPGPPPPGSRTVRTDDGVDLHVEFDGRDDAEITVVFSHGFTARLAEFDVHRTGRDLGQVLDAVVPQGPVVLAGHSMGGMSIMALARQRPELFGPRVVGAFLLATSSGGLVSRGPLGLWVTAVRRLHLLGLWLRGLQLVAPLLERFRRRGTTAGRWFTRRYLFGRSDADPADVRVVQDLLEETPLTVTLAFWATFLDHDETAALPVLGRVPTTVVAATDDRLTPVGHGRRLAELLGDDAELVVVPGAGHSVNLTRTDVVDAALSELLDRVEERRRRSAAAG